MAPPLDLPQELIDHIIDLQEDFPALKTCSLLGRRWLPHAQEYIFHSLSLPCRRDTPGYIIMSESGDISPDDAEQRISDILHFLRSNHRLASVVRSFTLNAQSSDTLARASSRMLADLPFRELTSFGIVMFPLSELRPPDFSRIEHLLKLNECSLGRLIFKSTGDAHQVQNLLRSCTSSLSKLCYLHISNLGIYTKRFQDSLLVDVARTRPQLETLRIGGWHYSPDFFSDVFLSVPALLDISSLETLQISTNHSLDPYNTLYQICGQSLLHLKLSMQLTELAEHHRIPFNYLQKLEKLEITFTERYSSNCFSLLLDMFSSRPALKYIQLTCSPTTARYQSNVQTMLTSEVDSALVAFVQRSPKLETVALVLPESLYEDVVSGGNLERCIPGAMGTGILKLSCLEG